MRNDISDFLIHFTKGNDIEDAFNNFISIINDMKLKAGNGKIKGNHKCICFSEAPINSINKGLVNKNYYSKYSPFGILVEKKWLYIKGGRPVIYQEEANYKKLHSDLQWRHVTFDLKYEIQIDFTWEREWRINQDDLKINEQNSKLILPDKYWASNLVDHFEWDTRNIEFQQYSQIFDELIAFQLLESNTNTFNWPIILLNE